MSYNESTIYTQKLKIRCHFIKRHKSHCVADRSEAWTWQPSVAVGVLKTCRYDFI
jgi:hypothetical protein